MTNKELFSTISDINEKFITDAWENTEPDSNPLVLRVIPKKHGRLGYICAAAACLAVIAAAGTIAAVNSRGENGVPIQPASIVDGVVDISGDTVTVREFFFYRPMLSDEAIKWLEWHAEQPESAEAAIPDELKGTLSQAANAWILRNVLEDGDKPAETADTSTLSEETRSWLEWFNTLSAMNKTRVGHVPEEVLFGSTASDVSDTVQYGVYMFYRPALSEQTLMWLEQYNSPFEDKVFLGDAPAELRTELSANEETILSLLQRTNSPDAIAAALSPENFEKAEKWLEWFYSLSSVGRRLTCGIPEELENISETNLVSYAGTPLPFVLYGADHVQICYEDICRIVDKDGSDMAIEDLTADNWNTIICSFAFLAMPGEGEFTRYYIGDEIGGHKIIAASSTYTRATASGMTDKQMTEENFPRALLYDGSSVQMTGKMTYIARISKYGGKSYGFKYAYGLPIIGYDSLALKRDQFVPLDFSDADSARTTWRELPETFQEIAAFFDDPDSEFYYARITSNALSMESTTTLNQFGPIYKANIDGFEAIEIEADDLVVDAAIVQE